jgi:hypothetical protein
MFCSRHAFPSAIPKLPGGHTADGLHVSLHRFLLLSHGLNDIFLLPRGIESRSTSVGLACSGPKPVSPTFLVIKQCSFLPRSATGQHQTNRHRQRYSHWHAMFRRQRIFITASAATRQRG